MTEPKTHSPVSEFKRVLDPVSARVFVFSPDRRGNEVKAGRPALAVAFSGGMDSTVLLHLAKDYAAENSMALFAFHVHHGLSVKADEWLSHCRGECERLSIRFDARRITLNPAEDEGVEAAARRKRYAALTEMCRMHGAGLLLTAHHEDDQAETVLLQLMRGAGVMGLSGMDVLGAVPGSDGEDEPQLLRPLLAVSRQSLENLAREKGFVWVEDDSNADLRYARNAVRLKVAPVLSGFFPGFERQVTRSARHMQSAQRLLDELAEMDWNACRDGDALDIVRMAERGMDRFDNLFRFWLDRHGLRMPSAAWLLEARSQLLNARDDAQIRLDLEGAVIRRYRNRLIFRKPEDASESGGRQTAPLSFVWQGESCLPVAAFSGEFLFERVSEGVDEAWLRSQSLRVGIYSGKAVLRVNANRPARNLKAHYQERHVPFWERQRLPLLYAGDRLLFAAGIGISADYAGTGGSRIWISWAPSPQVLD